MSGARRGPKKGSSAHSGSDARAERRGYFDKEWVEGIQLASGLSHAELGAGICVASTIKRAIHNGFIDRKLIGRLKERVSQVAAALKSEHRSIYDQIVLEAPEGRSWPPGDGSGPCEITWRKGSLEIPSLHADYDRLRRLCVGRDAVAKEIQGFVEEAQDRGALAVINGDQGVGKTTFIYYLFERLDAYKVLLHSLGHGNDPKMFLAELIRQCGKESKSATSPEELGIQLQRFMHEIAEESKKPCVALIDAVEELPCMDGNWHQALDWLPSSLPRRVVFIVTCPSSKPLLNVLRIKGCRKTWTLGTLPQTNQCKTAWKEAYENYLECAAKAFELLDVNRLFRVTGGNPQWMAQVVTEQAEACRQREGNAQAVDLGQCPETELEWRRRAWRQARNPPWGDVHVERRELLLQYLSCAGDGGISARLLAMLLEEAEGVRVRAEHVVRQLEHMGHHAQEVPGAEDFELQRFRLAQDRLREYVHSQVLRPGGVRRIHRVIFKALLGEGLALDPEYVAHNLLRHALLAQPPDALIADADGVIAGAVRGDIIEAVLTHGAGTSHGSLLRRLAQTLADGGRAWNNQLVREWGAESPRTKALRAHPARLRELIRLFVSADLPLESGNGERATKRRTGRVPSMLEATAELYDALRAASRDDVLLEQAQHCYQKCDLWKRALKLLEENESQVAARARTAVRDEKRRLNLCAAKAKYLRAQILFDSDAKGDPATLLGKCHEEFEELGEERLIAETDESLGIVLDAAGEWKQALERYKRAETWYLKQNDDLAMARVRMNKAISQLFVEGWEKANETLEELASEPVLTLAAEYADTAADGGQAVQLRGYWSLNRALLAIMGRDVKKGTDYLVQARQTSEKWLRASCDQLAHVGGFLNSRAWRSEVPEAVRRTRNELVAMGDAWGAVDASLNEGFMLLELGKKKEACRCFHRAREESRGRESYYKLGHALASHGLSKSSGQKYLEGEDDPGTVAFAKHLENCAFPATTEFFFAPTYVLLFPQLLL